MGCHTQCLMSFVMIIFDMGLNSSKKFKARIARVQIDVFIFDGFPKTFYSSPYHFHEKNGTVVTDYSSCTYNGTIYGSNYLAENICNTNSIATLTTGNQPAIFPNPTKSGFYIPLNFYNAGNINVEIFDTSMKTNDSDQ
jgi:hypothetical protein